MTDEQQLHKERINYTVSDGYYIGYSVNIPGIIVQAKSMEEMEKKIKATFKMWMKMMNEVLESGEPFEYKHLTHAEWHKENK